MTDQLVNMNDQYMEAIQHGLDKGMTLEDLARLIHEYDQSNLASRLEPAINMSISKANDQEIIELLYDLKEYLEDGYL